MAMCDSFRHLHPGVSAASYHTLGGKKDRLDYIMVPPSTLLSNANSTLVSAAIHNTKIGNTSVDHCPCLCDLRISKEVKHKSLLGNTTGEKDEPLRVQRFVDILSEAEKKSSESLNEAVGNMSLSIGTACEWASELDRYVTDGVCTEETVSLINKAAGQYLFYGWNSCRHSSVISNIKFSIQRNIEVYSY